MITKTIKTALLFFTTLTFIACSSSGSDDPPADPPAPKVRISIADATGSEEGGTIGFKVTADSEAHTINFRYQIDFAGQTANQNDLDLSNLSDTFIGGGIIERGNSSTTISIPIEDDDIKEPAETFQITLISTLSTNTIITDSTSTGTILASDSGGVKTEIRISDGNPLAAGEGENINFTVTSAQAIAEQINFNYRIKFDDPITSVSASTDDLSGNLAGTGHIAANSDSTTISFGIVDDNLREEFEIFMVMLSNLTPTDATFVDEIGRGTISANDNNATGKVTISVADAEASEASSEIVFRVSSKFPAVTGSQFTFDYEATLDIGNQDNSADTNDFTYQTGTATIPAGQNSTTISIPLKQDATVEENETFRLLLTNPSPNVNLARVSAKGTILNDDVSNVSSATATLEDGEITLNWTNPNSNIFAGVTIAQTTSDTAAPSCNPATNVKIIDAQQTTSRNITNLTTGTAYSFRICARSTAGSLSNGVELANITFRKADNDGDGLIEITNAAELYNIRYNLEGTSYKTGGADSGLNTGCPDDTCRGYELTKDIDLSNGYPNSPNWELPKTGVFTAATFDGNGYTISNLTINGHLNGLNFIGLFRAISDASIGNLKIAKISVTGDTMAFGGSGAAGALAGRATRTTLSNIELIGGSITVTGNNIGGLVGDFRSGTITDSTSSLTIRGKH